MFKKLILFALMVPSSMVVASEQPGMFKKLVLTALSVPVSSVASSPVVAAELPKINQVPVETMQNNIMNSVPGFCEFFYKTGLAGTRFLLTTSQSAAKLGNYFADNPMVFGTVATVGTAAYLYFRHAENRPSWMNLQPMYQMWHNGRQWFSPAQPPQ